jgi:6-phosphogluconate dehydrogenase
LNVLHHADAGLAGTAEFDAETAPLRNPELYRYQIDVAAVTEVWRRGSVIASWLLDLIATSLHASPALSQFQGRVSDSGEGRWTVEAAVEEGVPVPIISAALFNRFSSRGASEFADRVLSAMRSQFGGHGESQTTS